MSMLVNTILQQWIRKNVLRQSEEEIEMIDKQIDIEKEDDGEGEDDFSM